MLHEKNPLTHTFIEAVCRGGARRAGVHFFAEGEFSHIMIKYFFKLLLSKVQGPLQNAQSPDRDSSDGGQILQRTGRQLQLPRSKSCPHQGTWAALPPWDSLLLPPLTETTGGKDFLPPSIWCLSAGFSIRRNDLAQTQPSFWVSCRFLMLLEQKKGVLPKEVEITCFLNSLA